MIRPGSVLELEDGRKLGFGEAGDPRGFPIIYLHASMGSRTVPSLWDREASAAGARLITPERPGFGHSDFQSGRTLLDWPKDLAVLCDSLKIDRFALCGLSGGGPFVIACAYALSGRVTAAACMAGLAPLDRQDAFDGFRDSERGVYDVAMQSPTAAVDIVRAMEKQVREDPLAWRETYRAPDTLDATDREELATYMLETVVLDSCRGGPQGIAYEWWLYCQPWGFPLADVRLPIDLWHSADDEMLPSQHPRYLIAHLPSARLRIWPNGGHLAGAARLGEVLRSCVAASKAH